MTDVVRLAMPAKSEYLILARLALAGIAREVPMSETVLADLKLAVTEACGNVVRHAYPSSEGVVELRFEVGSDEIHIEVVDRGTGRADAPVDSAPFEEGLVESGMGVAIIRAVVDELDISDRADDGGTVVRMRKRLLPI